VAVGDASIWLKQPDCTLWYGRTLPWIQLHALGARGVLDIRPIRIAKSLTARGTLAAWTRGQRSRRSGLV